jgi:16S rRNA (cytosine967-C5)-methyltransferase
MSIAQGQKRTFLRMLAELRPLARKEAGLPSRLEAMLREDKRLGSRDRRLYRELVYTYLRHLPWLENLEEELLVARCAALCAETKATQAFREALMAGETGKNLGSKEELLPAWLREECPEAFTEPLLSRLLERAPLWLRLRTQEDLEPVQLEFAQRGWRLEPSTVIKQACRFMQEADLTKTESYLAGRYEVQDLGSQLILEACGIKAGEHWLDACAGAGGKTLHLAGLLGTAGKIDAHDLRMLALAELAQRALRAGCAVNDPERMLRERLPMAKKGAGPLITLRREPLALYDGVLIDAPCSGSGTWRRQPQLKWCTGPDTIKRMAILQREVLETFCECVKPGGRLIYATCSLCRSENEAVVEAFLAAHADFSLGTLSQTFGYGPGHGMLRIMPDRHDSDGFFVASLVRKG